VELAAPQPLGHARDAAGQVVAVGAERQPEQLGRQRLGGGRLKVGAPEGAAAVRAWAGGRIGARTARVRDRIGSALGNLPRVLPHEYQRT
jgi:hypothetical protein